MIVTVRSMRELRELTNHAKGQWVDNACMILRRRDGTQEVIHDDIPTIPFHFMYPECYGGAAEAYRRASKDEKRRMLKAHGAEPRTDDEIERILDQ